MVSVFSVGARPLLQGVPSFKQSTGLFEIHPLPSARSVRVFRRLRTAARALPLTRQPFLREKAGPKNLSCLWQVLKGNADTQILIYRGLHNAGLLMYCPHKVKARSGTKAAACSNRYATESKASEARFLSRRTDLWKKVTIRHLQIHTLYDIIILYVFVR